MTKENTEDEEVVEMGKGDDGAYRPVAIVKMKEDRSITTYASGHLPRWFPAVYEVVDGFVIGLGAIENFMRNMRKINVRVRK